MAGALKPANAVGSSFGVVNGEYIIKSCKAHIFDYQGKADPVAAALITFENASGVLSEQNYSAGKTGSISDGRFTAVAKKSDLFQFITSAIAGGFPEDKLDDDISVFEGCRVLIRNEAKPKIESTDKDKTIALIEKVLALPGAKATKPNGAAKVDTTEAAITAVQTALAEAAGNKLERVSLGTKVFLRLTKENNPAATEIKKLAQDSTWLAANAEAGGWTSDGKTISLG